MNDLLKLFLRSQALKFQTLNPSNSSTSLTLASINGLDVSASNTLLNTHGNSDFLIKESSISNPMSNS